MNKSRMTTAIALMLLTTPAFAHPGHMEHGLSSGLLHPMTGLDHLMMLLTSGFLAALTGRRLSLPLMTVLAMITGTAAGVWFGGNNLVEPLVLASVWFAGAMIFASNRLSVLSWMMPCFALFHGWAHGVEAPAGQVALFTVGAAISSVVLLAVGYVVGTKANQVAWLKKGWAATVFAAASVLLVG
ncbi:HupE/UreJ family protein [Tolumonas lignilytica]|uniref:HupE/UreJ family protein n=1 Tax=Tolumonas lignilytica TaxID=1283284 RepID=UPI000466F144|nr:HupE/UreJ family protein [Tolumonas lignilytica]